MGRVPCIFGRVLDLKNAYKQLFLCEGHRHMLALQPGIHIQEDHQLLDKSPRQSIASARAAWAIRWPGLKLFDLAWVHYFDDYAMFDVDLTVGNSQKVAKLFLDCLGWSFAVDEKKRQHASNIFQVLGAELDLTEFGKGE